MTTTVSGTATRLKPLGRTSFVKPTPREEMTKSGIVLPDTAKERPQEGTILAVGPGRTLDNGKREEMEVSEGQKVLFQKYAGTEFKLRRRRAPDPVPEGHPGRHRVAAPPRRNEREPWRSSCCSRKRRVAR